jgi:putative hydrolase of the HAD superfamily
LELGVDMSEEQATKAVVFDFGGVLFNWQPSRLIQTVLPHHAANDEQALALAATLFQSFVPGSYWSEFDRGALDWEEVASRISSRSGLALDDVFTVMSAIPPHLAPVRPTVAWLEELAASGVRLHFLSNMPQPYAEFLQREHAFLKHFQSGVFSCDVGQVKPNADIFHTACERFGLQPHEMLFIDDNMHNIDTATSLGWRAVSFANATQARAEVKEKGWMPRMGNQPM